MKKKLLLAGAILVMVASAVTGYTVYSKSGMSDLLYANLEALTDDEAIDEGESEGCSYCYSGGIGATGCSIEAGTNIFGFGASAGCSVSCAGSYYACCSIRCVCCS